MNIHEYGEIVLCKNIKFEDNKIDMQLGHPGIILLPTNEEDDYTYCLYMTSDAKRASKEKNKYIKNTGRAQKESYINLQQIIKRANIKNGYITKLGDRQFKEILEKFYNYQIALQPPKEEFLEIKSKVETFLEILNINEEFNISRTVSQKEINSLTSINDKFKKRMIYQVYLLISENNQNLKEQNFTSKKDKKYFENLLKTYNKIKDIDFNKLDFNIPNNELRQFYINSKVENSLINVDILFNEVATIFSMQNNNNKSELIKFFIKSEQTRETAKIKAKEEKRLKKKRDAQKKSNQRNQKRKSYYIDKYGNFDMDFFDN